MKGGEHRHRKDGVLGGPGSHLGESKMGKGGRREKLLHWPINDIIGYANNDKATMYGYVDNFYNIFNRNSSLQTNNDIDKYLYKNR